MWGGAALWGTEVSGCGNSEAGEVRVNPKGPCEDWLLLREGALACEHDEVDGAGGQSTGRLWGQGGQWDTEEGQARQEEAPHSPVIHT